MSTIKETDRLWCVYLHKVPKEISGYEYDKYYIGMTNQKPELRWGRNGGGYRQQVFYHAIQKYGWNNIIHQIVANGLNKNEAVELERSLISLYQTRNKEFGYNFTDGGEGCLGCNASEKTKQLLSVVAKERWKNEDYRNHVTDSVPRGNDHPFARKVVLLNTQEVFGTIKEASIKTGIGKEAIQRQCSEGTISRKKDSNGYRLIWMYYEDYEKLSEQEVQEKLLSIEEKFQKQREQIRRGWKKQEPFVCLNNNDIVNYDIDLEEKYHTRSSSVIQCIKRNQRVSGHLADGTPAVWCRYNEYITLSPEQINEYINHALHLKSIIDLETNTVYKSIRLCSRRTKVCESTLYKILTQKVNSKKYQGRFRFYLDYLNEKGITEEEVKASFVFC